MQPSAQEEERLLRDGAEALRQGRAAEARARFERLAAAGSVRPLTWLLLAMSCRHGRDPEAEEAALNRLLELDPHSVNGNAMKGDCRAGSGDETGAIYFYRAAVRRPRGADLRHLAARAHAGASGTS